MFFGQYCHTVDDKSRLSIPARLRAELVANADDPVYLARGMDRNILLFNRAKWEEIQQVLKNFSLFDPVAREVKRAFYSGAFPTTFDKQGRLVLPQPLVKYASISRDVVVVGVSDCVEIWDARMWEERERSMLESYNDLARKLASAPQR